MGRHRFLVLGAIALLTVILLVISRANARLLEANQAVSIASLALLLPSIVSVAGYHLQAVSGKSDVSERALTLRVPSGKEGSLPDIYYIIVDGYARSDVLGDLYDFDNSQFLDFLRGMGFYVAEGSCSNYGQTLLSLASSLNLDYVQDLPGVPGESSDDRTFLADMIRRSTVRESLRGIGYRLVAFETTLNDTSLDDADIYYSTYREYTSLAALNAFESQLVATTFLRFLLDIGARVERSLSSVAIDPAYERHRIRITYTLSTLGEVASLDGPDLVFVHVLAPHAPFVFGPHGERLEHHRPFTLKDTGTYYGSPQEYIRLYRDQVAYLNGLLMNAIAEILRRGHPTPIIILQADHGPGAYLDWDRPDERSIYERFSILNAYLVPERVRAKLYPSITPVNTFRLVFAEQFGAEVPLLEDRVYSTVGGSLYSFVDVTSIACP